MVALHFLFPCSLPSSLFSLYSFSCVSPARFVNLDKKSLINAIIKPVIFESFLVNDGQARLFAKIKKYRTDFNLDAQACVTASPKLTYSFRLMTGYSTQNAL
jgi:hypothetical protein